LLLLGIVVTGFSMHTARRLATARAQAEARFVARRAAATATRPDVFGAAIPGDAWSDWITALAAIDMSELDALESALTDEPGARAPSPLELGRIDEAIAHHAVALDALVRGARRASGRFPVDDARQTAVLDDAFRPLALGRLAARAAERRMARGDATGIDLALAAAQFGREGKRVMLVAGDDEFGRLQRAPADVGPTTQSPYIIVADADAHYARAKAAGAQIVLEIKDEDYGGRGYSCRDPQGHLWNFGTYDPWAPH